MTVPDPTRLSGVGGTQQHVPPSVVARCEGCELAFVVDVLSASIGHEVAACDDCGSPVYAIALATDPVYLAGLGLGWDACAAFVASVVAGEQAEELAGLDLSDLVEGVE